MVAEVEEHSYASENEIREAVSTRIQTTLSRLFDSILYPRAAMQDNRSRREKEEASIVNLTVHYGTYLTNMSHGPWIPC